MKNLSKTRLQLRPERRKGGWSKEVSHWKWKSELLTNDLSELDKHVTGKESGSAGGRALKE